MFGFDHFIAPVTRDEFRETYFSRRAMFVANPTGKFEDLLNWDDWELIKRSKKAVHPALRVVHDGEDQGPDALGCLKKWVDGLGAELALAEAQKFDPLISGFSETLSRDLNVPVAVSIHESAPAVTKIDTKTRQNDVFVVQLEGSQIWKIFNPDTPSHRVRGEQGPDEWKVGVPCAESEVTKGGVVYIPANHPYYAVPLSRSLSLEFTVIAPTAVEFLTWAVKRRLETVPEPIKAIPVAGLAGIGRGITEKKVVEYVENLRSKVLEILEEKVFAEQLSEFIYINNQIDGAARDQAGFSNDTEIGLETLFVSNPLQKFWIRHDPGRGYATIVGRGAKIVLKGVPSQLIDILLGGDSATSGRDLLIRFPGLHWDSLKPVLTECMAKGFIVTVDE